MAVTVINRPNDINCLSDCISWELKLDSLGVTPESKKIAYQLWCPDTNAPITEVSSVSPKSADEVVSIDFTEDLACRLFTHIPDLAILNFTQDDLGIKKDFELRYGEVTLNADDCELNNIDLSQVDGPFTVVNSYKQNDRGASIDPYLVLNEFGKVKVICQDSLDYLWLCGEANVTIDLTLKAGNTNTSIGLVKDKILGVGPNQISVQTGIPLDQICGYTINVGVDSYRYQVKKCCCETNCRLDMYYLDPLGGRHLMDFGCVESITIEKEGSTICRAKNCQTTYAQAVRNFGHKYMSKRLWKKITVTKKFKSTKSNLRVLQAFASSSEYHVRPFDADSAASFQLFGFVVENTSIPIYNKSGYTEITITGYYSLDENVH